MSSNNDDSQNLQSNKQLNDKSIKELNNKSTKELINLSEEMCYKLDWKDKNRLINILNNFIALNYDLNYLEKEKVSKKNDEIILNLTKLEIKIDDNLEEQPNKKMKTESLKKNLLLNLTESMRTKIINCLVKNRNLIFNYNDKIDNNTKSNLIKENQNLIINLMNLPVIIPNSKSNELLYENYNYLDDSEEECELNEKELSRELIIRLTKEIKELKNELINERSEARLKTELIDVKKFFETPNHFNSKRFICRDLEWYIGLKSIIDDKKRCLSFYLHVKNDQDDSENIIWECETEFELRLCSYLPSIKDKIENVRFKFTKSIGYGFLNFISFDELIDLNNAYVKNDSLNVEVYLKAGRIYRNN